MTLNILYFPRRDVIRVEFTKCACVHSNFTYFYPGQHLRDIFIYTLSSLSSTISQRFKGNRCESGMFIFKWKVTWNYANSLFKWTFSIEINWSRVFYKFVCLKIKKKWKQGCSIFFRDTLYFYLHKYEQIKVFCIVWPIMIYNVCTYIYIYIYKTVFLYLWKSTIKEKYVSKQG